MVQQKNKSLNANETKNLVIDVHNKNYARYPVKTKLVEEEDNLGQIIEEVIEPYLEEGDLIFVAESIVAIAQDRAYPVDEIEPSFLAKFFVKFVHETPHGIGLGSPWTMELAIREAGLPRFFLAAFLSAITKPFGIKGVFYRVIGKDVKAIDGPCDSTIAPYNEFATLPPEQPSRVAEKIKKEVKVDVVIIDANDLGVSVLGKTEGATSDEFCKKVFRDNPLGQSSQQTPVAIVRKMN